jgi:hypothetical protein
MPGCPQLVRPVCLALVLAMFPTLCWGRLGETEEQLNARYGEPTFESTKKGTMPAPAEKHLEYLKDGVVISVALYQGRSVIENYAFKDENRRAVSIDGDVVAKADAIVQVNGGGFEWKRHPNPQAENREVLHAWHRKDGRARALVWANQADVLEVTDLLFMEELVRAQEAESAGASGF